MGITRSTIRYEKQILNSLGLEYKGLKWCELGNQITYKGVVAKEIYLSLGVEHISIDINGQDGALPIDLDKPVPFIFLNQFNVITNYGTIEHINNQYQAFKNVHDMCKENGIMIHVMPLKGHWPKHCRYYYTPEFVKGLAKSCDYQIVNFTILDKDENKTPKNEIAVTYLKKSTPFVSKKDFEQIGGIIDTGDTTYTGNYTQREIEELIHIIRKLPSPLKKIGRTILRSYKMLTK